MPQSKYSTRFNDFLYAIDGTGVEFGSNSLHLKLRCKEKAASGRAPRLLLNSDRMGVRIPFKPSIGVIIVQTVQPAIAPASCEHTVSSSPCSHKLWTTHHMATDAETLSTSSVFLLSAGFELLEPQAVIVQRAQQNRVRDGPPERRWRCALVKRSRAFLSDRAEEAV